MTAIKTAETCQESSHVRLLRSVNEIAALLLGANVDSFVQTIFLCMEKIGHLVEADRVYIWKNHMQNGELYCTQIYEWSGGAEPQQGNELTLSVPFPESWYPVLSTNRCVNGMVKTFERFEREHLAAQGIISILVVPVFMKNKFWGFVGFDDCCHEHTFSDAEEAVLRSVSLLFATSMLRNNINSSLIRAKEEALSSARAKTNFLANMSHEVRTPINAITGMSRIARTSNDKNRVNECLDHIDAASQQLLALLNDVLDMSNIESGKLVLNNTPFDLLGLLHNIKSISGIRAMEKKHDFQVELAPNLPEFVVGDSTRLAQVLFNLISNAVKFTPDGGKINLSASAISNTPDGFVELEFTVADNGIGIAPEETERLFNKFEQGEKGMSRRFGGSGLGLSICKSILELAGGSIEADSTPGQGSRFTVRLKLEAGKPEDMQHPLPGREENSLHDFSAYTALLVEDIDINREIMQALLADTGMTIDEAQDGQVAFDMFKAAPERYDMIFMDLHMPVKDGYEATKDIRASGLPKAGSIPIIAVTANAFAEDVQRCIEAGMNGHIAKPVDFDMLAKEIEKHLGNTLA